MLLVDTVCQSRSMTRNSNESGKGKEDSTNNVTANQELRSDKDEMTETRDMREPEAMDENGEATDENGEATSALSSNGGAGFISPSASLPPLNEPGRVLQVAGSTSGYGALREPEATCAVSSTHANCRDNDADYIPASASPPLNKPNPVLLYDASRGARTDSDNVLRVGGSTGGAQFMGVDLDPFHSLVGNAGIQDPWWMADSFLNTLNVPGIDIQSWNGTDLSSYNAFVQIQQESFLGGNGQFIPPTQTASVETSLPSKVLNELGSAIIDKPLTVQSQLPCPVNVALHSTSTNHSPDAATGCPVELPDKNSLESTAAAQKVSKFGRSIIPSTRHEKMNEIGSNKENAVPVTVPLKSNSDWVEHAKKYMLDLELGEDWKACVTVG